MIDPAMEFELALKLFLGKAAYHISENKDGNNYR